MTIKDWPQAERPREKLLRFGAAALSDAELLAIFLQTGTAGKSAVEVARDALRSFGSLGAVLNAEQAAFCKGPGLGLARYALLQASQEVSRRHVFETVMQGDVLSSPEHVRHYLSLHLTGLGHEVFSALFLDNRHRVIEYRELFTGTIDSAAVYPREVVKRCLNSNAAAVRCYSPRKEDFTGRILSRIIWPRCCVNGPVLTEQVVTPGVEHWQPICCMIRANI